MTYEECKVGTKVRVRAWEDMEKEFGLDSDGDVKTHEHEQMCFAKDMSDFCGKETFITGLNPGNRFVDDEVLLEIEEKKGYWHFVPNMLELIE